MFEDIQKIVNNIMIKTKIVRTKDTNFLSPYFYIYIYIYMFVMYLGILHLTNLY